MIDILNNLKMFLIGPFQQGSLGGLAINILLALMTMISGFVLGLLLALGRISKKVVICKIATFLIETTRSLPLLLIVFLVLFFDSAFYRETIADLFECLSFNHLIFSSKSSRDYSWWFYEYQ